MGQRSQVIIKVPARFINEENPNNHEAYYIVYHNQWFYGEMFPWFIKEFHIQLNKYLNYRKKSPLNKYTIDWNELIERIINTINYQDITAHQRFSKYYERWEYAKLLLDHGVHDWQGFLNLFDNNNGFIFLVPDEEGNVQYDVLSGTEDTDFIRRVSLLEYVNLFTRNPQRDTEEEIKYSTKNCKRINIRDFALYESREQYEKFEKYEKPKKGAK